MIGRESLAVNGSDVPSNYPLPLFNGVIVLHWRQYEMTLFILLKHNILRLLHVRWNVCLITWIQILVSELSSCPPCKVFVGPIPPSIAGFCEWVPNIRRTLNATYTMRSKQIGKIEYTNWNDWTFFPSKYATMHITKALLLNFHSSTFSSFLWEVFPLLP